MGRRTAKEFRREQHQTVADVFNGGFKDLHTDKSTKNYKNKGIVIPSVEFFKNAPYLISEKDLIDDAWEMGM